MFGLMTLGSFFGKILASRASDGGSKTPEQREAEAKEALDKFNLMMHRGSISKLVNAYVIQPTIYVSKDLKANEDAINAIQSNLDIFASFLTMAFKRLVEVEGVDVRTTLTLLNTTSGGDELMQKFMVVGYQTLSGMQFHKNVKLESFSGHYVDIEDFGVNNVTSVLRGENKKIELTYRDVINNLRREADEVSVKIALGSKKSPDDIKTSSNVSVKNGVDLDKAQPGYDFLIRSFELSANITQKRKENNGKMEELDSVTVSCPIQVKANIVYIDQNDLAAVLVDKTGEHSFIRRWERWRAGGISFKEFLFASDLINEYRQAKIRDSKGMINKIKTMDEDSIAKYLATSKTFGYSRYYNMFVLTNEDAEFVGKILNKGNIGNKNAAKEIFLERLNGLMLTVVDQKWEIFNLGIKDMNGFSTASFKDLKKKKSKKDGGINDDILKLLLSNRMPTF